MGWLREPEWEATWKNPQRVTDSAGITCEYTPIEKLQPGDVVIIGWRTTVKRVEVEATRARIIWEWSPSPTGESVDQWNLLGTLMPVEVTS